MLNRLYYPLSEAIKTLKGRRTDISINDLLHYGVQGKVRFFVHVPSGTLVRQISASLPTPHDFQPNLLILSPSQCGEIECNKSTRQSEFPSAYADIYSNNEIPPCARNLQYPDKIYWQAIDRDGEIDRILLTKQTICIHHSELAQLHQLIDSTNNPPVEFIPQFDKEQQQEINLRCYTFDDALKIAKEKIDGFTEIDLLRYGYFEKLTFLIQHPKNLAIAIANERNPSATNIAPTPKPDLLAIHPEDCYQIEIFGRTQRSNFKVGFLCHYGTLIPILPKQTPDIIYESLESSNLSTVRNYRLRVDTITNGNLRWRIYNQSLPYTIEINKNILYVIRSEFDRLIAEESFSDKIGANKTPYIPEFTISKITKYYLSPKKFIPLSDAAKLAKCYTNELLIHASQGTIELLTPVPCEISLCQTRHPVDNSDELLKSRTNILASVDKIPQLLVLEKEDCEAIATNGHVKRGDFKNGYSFKFGELVRQTPYYLLFIKSYSLANTPPSDCDMHSGVWLTFYLDKPKKIDITIDRIFIELSKFKKLIESSPDIFKSRNDNFIETELSISDQLNSVSTETISGGISKQSRINLTDDAVLIGDNSTAIDIVTVKEFMELSGISRTTIDNKSKDRVKYPDFPRKIKDDDNVHVHFLRPEVNAWLRKNPPRNRKRKEKQNQP